MPPPRVQDVGKEKAAHLSEKEALGRTGRLLCDIPCSSPRASPPFLPSPACLEKHCITFLFLAITQLFLYFPPGLNETGLLGLPASIRLQKDLSQIPSSHAVTLATAKSPSCLLARACPLFLFLHTVHPTLVWLSSIHLSILTDIPTSLSCPSVCTLKASGTNE